MPTPVIVAADIREAAERGSARIEVGPGTIVTPLAVDEARERGVELHEVALDAHRTRPDAPPRPTVRHVSTRGLVLDPFPLPGPPPQLDVRLRDVITAEHGAPVAVGVMSLREGSFPWHLTYDEVQVVLEGELHLGTDAGTVIGLPGDVLFVPRDTHVTFATPGWARFLYVTYPAAWDEQVAP